ncbi:unnamed protein product [Gongylonema pulchrum]|uniref:V-type proton ATPase subunit H n=1 Tax=Gongylonema pulchrum TaxID=637853 RepID=A0A183ECC4_9BILA|nr:unnamed protein product [Gongylonema pulchrum]
MVEIPASKMTDQSGDMQTAHIASMDMISATSKLQLEAADVRNNRPNWNSYLRSQMIAQEDYNFITAYEATKTKQDRDTLLDNNKTQCARTMINFITTVAKDQNVRYVLTLLDDMILVRDSSIFSLIFFFFESNANFCWFL